MRTASIFHRGPTARATVFSFGARRRAAGLHSAMIADHIVCRREPMTYPYTLTASTRASAIALETSRSSVCGWRNGAAAARHLRAGIAISHPVLTRRGGLVGFLSGGRLTLGVGAG